MNKKLIALAVAGACAAPVAMAQTANPVTLYGRVHATFDYVESKGSVGVSKRSKVTDQASRLGVRGTEDLGGGLKAFFQLETAFRPDSNDTTFAARNSGVGLTGGWGSLFMGRWDTPFKLANGDVDPLGDVTIGGLTNAMSDQANFDRRDQNSVHYWTPNWGGFALKAMYQTNEGKTSTVNPYDVGLSATFNRGPVYVFVAYEEHNDQGSGTTNTPTGDSTPQAGSDEEGLAIGGTFAFGPVKVGGIWQEFKKTGRTKRESWMANVVWTVGNSQFIYQFQQMENGGLNGSAQPECDVNAIAWRYNFSRRTTGYLLYSKIDNNAVSNCGRGGTSYSTVATTGSDPQGFSVGMMVQF